MPNNKQKKFEEDLRETHSLTKFFSSTQPIEKTNRVWSILLRYGLAIGLFAITLGISLLLSRFEIKINLTILIVVGLFVAAWYGGRGPGLLLAVLLEAATIVMTPIAPETPFAKVVFGYFSLGAVLVFIVLIISGRKVIEKRLRDSEKSYRNLFENNPLPMWVYDLETLDFLAVNDASVFYYGYSEEEFLKMNIRDIRPPEDIPSLLKKISKPGEEAEACKSWRHRKKDGSLIDVEITSHEIVFDGRISKLVLANDITRRKQTEKELSKLAAIVESSNDAIISVNLENVLISWNKGAEKVFGYSAAEAIGQKVSIIYLPGHPAEESEALARGKKGESLRHFETTRRRKDGSEISVSITVSPIRDAEGTIVAVSGIIHDITERRRAATALRESEYKLRALVENMSEGLLQVDSEDRIQFVNSCLCEMVGYEEEELIGTDWSDLLFKEERDLVKQINERRQSGISDRYEIQLQKKSGEILWVIVGGAPLINAEGVITGSLGTFTDITERKRTEEQLLHDAFHDGLTGLANRSLFIDHVQLTIERSKRKPEATFAVLFLDFDRFKIINDSLGHAEGDNLLKQISQRLEGSLRPGDLVARLGGDEFTILLNELNDESGALQIAERIQEDLKKSFDLSGREIYISASIGIALSAAGHTRAEDILRDADIAMYRAKAKGKAQYQVFDHEMHRSAQAQLQFETEMRQALEKNEFCLHYQPIMKLETNELAGFEALVRWNHPTLGLVSPMDFIPVAEETGLILPLGRWIILESCRQLRKWQNHNSLAPDIKISVNLSCKQFLQFDLAEQVAAILEETGLAPSCLKLEITESYILENTEMAVAMMSRLRALGVEISLDDFGTGYSSLSYLHRFPIDYLKIDRSFVSRMTESTENAEIVYTIIKLARNLKMKVVAEGIETAEQLAKLKQLDCEYGQGYFFSKPLEPTAGALVNIMNKNAGVLVMSDRW